MGICRPSKMPYSGISHGDTNRPLSETRTSLGSEQRKKNGLSNTRAGEQHDQSVDTHSHASCGGHAVLHRLEERLVELHRLGVALRGEQRLLFEPTALLDRVVQLGIGGRQLDPV